MLLLFGAIGILAGFGWTYHSQQQADEILMRHVEARVQAALDERFAAIEAHTPDTSGLALPGYPDVVVQEYHQQRGLLRWSSRQFSPTTRMAQVQLSHPQSELLNDDQYLYYNYKKRKGERTWFYLIPLRIDPPIQNAFLQNYLFLGDYNDQVDVQALFQTHQLSLQPNPKAVNLNDARGESLISFVFNDTTPFRIDGISTGLAVSFGSFLLLLLGARIWLLNRGWQAWQLDLLLLAVFSAARILVYVVGLPVELYQTRLFSSQVLALSSISPSIGDFTLNLLLLLLSILFLYRYLPVQQFATRVQALGQPAALAGVAGSGAVLTGAFGAVFALVNRAVLNSQVSLRLTDFYSINWASWLLLIDLAMLFGCLGLLMLLYVQFVHKIIRKPLLLWLSGGVVMLGLMVVPVAMYFNLPLLLAPTFALSTLLLYFVWQGVEQANEWRLIHTFGVVFVLAVLSNQMMNVSITRELEAKMRTIPERFAEQKNLLTESAFDGVVQAIQSDRYLWQRQTDTFRQSEFPFQELARSLTSRHLLSAFKQYDTRVFFFKDGRRIDESFDQQPYRLTDKKRVNGLTISEHLYRVPYSRSVTQNIYVGEFQVRSRAYGRLRVQIELHPKANVSNRLYPQLLLDENIKQQMQMPPNLSVAVYVDSQLVRQEGDERFPLRAGALSMTKPGEIAQHKTHSQLVNDRHDDRLIVVRAQQPDVFNRLTGFSILFYFYAVLLLLAYIPRLVEDWRQSGYSFLPSSLAKRMQFFLLVLTLVPMIVMWLLTVPLFTRFFNESTVEDSQSTLVQAGNYLESQPIFVEQLAMAWEQPGGDMASQDLLTQMSEILSVDLNVYDYLGQLYLTTRPKIFEAGLVSRLINPEAYFQLLEKRQPYRILEEDIGDLSYNSGYIPIVDENKQIAGFVNIPFLLQQDLLREQVRNFVAYLINVYVVLILIMATAGIFISRSLTNPLRLLREKLADTRFGLHNEPIQWQRRDEIGQIVEAYNDMLMQLEESQRKLAKSEREIAWREMARQVAHEIKNPLTPMKLSIQQLERILQRSEDDKIQQFGERYAKTLLGQIDSLTAIANSFSQFATMPAAAQDRLNLNDILREAYTLYLQEDGVTLAYTPPEVQLYIAGDKNQLMRVLVNLIRNAIQAEGDQLSLTLVQDEKHAIIRLQDNGKGIPLKIQQKVFEPNFSTKTSGMGLGLAITKRIIEAMNGTIGFESTPGNGTTFTLRFPLHETRDA